MKSNLTPLSLKNPHSVLEALRTRPGDVEKIALAREAGPAWQEVEKLAQANGIRVEALVGGGGKSAPNQFRATQTHAVVRPKAPLSIEELIKSAQQQIQMRKRQYGTIVVLDCVQDPQNVGSIFRSAAFFGVAGILLTEDRTSDLSSVVYDVSSGGVEAVPFAVEVNLRMALEKLKEQEFWILGTSEHAKLRLEKVPRDRNWALVLGNEEKGLRKLTLETCDMVTAIPQAYTPNSYDGAQVGSLNVSVAAGVLFHTLGQWVDRV